MKTIKLTSTSDPGHGWLRVPVQLISKTDVYHRISEFSYIDKNFVYLEEDCDAGLVIKSLESQGYKLEIKHRNVERTNIRNKARYSALTIAAALYFKSVKLGPGDAPLFSPELLT